MKYIQKLPIPQFFIDDTIGLTNWEQYSATFDLREKKRHLKEYILGKEQNGLCCYCENGITIHNLPAHIEHIKPKSLDNITLTFDYNNLLVSCQGNHFNEIGDNSKSTCGHIKDNNFDEVKFLNPTLVTDISDYFVFDSDTGIISASKKDKIKAEYTIQILNLNGKNDKLAHARKIAKDALIRNFNKLPIEERKLRLKAFLQNESNEFISFFRYLYNGFS